MIVDGGVVAVEEGGGGDDADFVLRLVGSDLGHGLNSLMWLGI